jgi:hypothetical protein
MQTRFAPRAFAATSLFVLAAMLAPSAGATQVGAWSGSPQSPGQWNCVRESYGGTAMTKFCDLTWDIPLPVAGPEVLSPKIWYRLNDDVVYVGPNGSTTDSLYCTVVTYSGNGAWTGGIGAWAPKGAAPDYEMSYQPGAPNQVYAVSGGYAFVRCFMTGYGVEVYTVSY